MKFTNHIVIECPREYVFHWMFQPKHIVQLVTKDHSHDFLKKRPIPHYILKQAMKQQRFLPHVETEIDIRNLSTSTLQNESTFRYARGVKGDYIEGVEGEFEGFHAFKPPTVTGTIIIKKVIHSTFFSFATSKGFIPSSEHHLSFHTQQERTIMTYTQSILFGKIQFRLLTAAASPALIPIGNEEIQEQLQFLKLQMEAAID